MYNDCYQMNHIHQYEGVTTYDDGHTHRYYGYTGGAIPTYGGHVHYYGGYTTFDDGTFISIVDTQVQLYQFLVGIFTI